MLDKLAQYRAEMLRQNVPSAVVEQWTDAALPCATLTTDGDGPVVGRYGGPLLLPPDAPDPEYPLVASLNCADLPEEVTGLPLPTDGRLLLFAFPDPDAYGEVMYVPEGAAVEERAKIPSFYGEAPDYREIVEAFPQGVLRLTTDVSLPLHGFRTKATAHGWQGEDLPWEPYGSEINATVWNVDGGGSPHDGWVQVGGHANEESMDVNPVESAAIQAGETGNLGDWVLLADWIPDIKGREGLFLHWVIRRQDLVARRFDRVCVTCFWNP
ncbi:protein of unknown function [Sinosporangium album]|uniref:DUF1963 domain-containing protein n=2 Tax=Sinosporangium album TaxID=504805 RepID=A0A1G7YCL2_9ACTN|nr:protein of unknown function [Sinosporangium album]